MLKNKQKQEIKLSVLKPKQLFSLPRKYSNFYSQTQFQLTKNIKLL